jgi:hypothetical protein
MVDNNFCNRLRNVTKCIGVHRPRPRAGNRSVTPHTESRVPLTAEHLWPEMEMNYRRLQAELHITSKHVQTLVLT